MNHVELIGSCVRDVELRKTTSGKSVATFTLLCDREFGDGKDYIRCQAWGERADLLSQYGKKDTQVSVIGNIRTGSYDDKDGKKVYTTDVVCNTIGFPEKQKSEDGVPYFPDDDNTDPILGSTLPEDLPF